MRLKKWLLGLVTFAAMAVLCAVCVGAEKYGDYLYYSVLDDGTVQITDCETGAETVVIPDTIDGKSVTSIGKYAFYYCSSLKSITIPSSVTSIGDYAFSGCTSLTNITIPSSVTSIGDYAFSGCKSLTTIDVEVGNNNYTSVDGVLFNKDKTELICYPARKTDKSYNILDSVTSIGDWAFIGCTSLTSITIPNGVTSIGDYAFYGCTSLTSITIPNSVSSIGKCAFENCLSLTSITIPSSVTSVSNNTFSNCESLTSITIPDSVVSIGNYAFSNCEALVSIKIPNSVTSIGEDAFKECISLTCILLPDSVTSIGDGAFEFCKNLKSLTIPNSVTRISDASFFYCKSLTSITISNNVTNIGSYAFSNCSSLKSITMPDSVTSIGSYAFSDCSSLKSITMPDSVTSIGGYAFNGCTSLTSVTIPNSVTEIGEYAFSDCKSLTSVTIPNSVTEIGEYAFSDCKSLTSITIPNSVSIIYECAFCDCLSLTSITIPNSVTYIGNFAFGYFSNNFVYDIKLDNFKVYCYNGSTGEKYAKDNGFKYELTDHTHLFDNWLITKAATCTTDGMQTRTCSACGKVETQTIKALGHTVVVDKAVAATCTKTGLTEGSHCSVCNTVIKAQEVVPAKGHQYTKTVVAPTYTSTGYTLYKCSVCGYSYKDNETAKLTLPKVTGFKVKSLTSTNVTLQWNKNTSASGYEIEQYKSGKWVNVAKITSNATTSYTVKELKAGTAGYQFRIRAYRTEGKNKAYSGYSATVKVNTNPYGVGGFKCSSKSSTSVTLKWNKGTTASGYQLQQYKGGKWVTIYTGTKATNTSYTVKGLKAGTAGYRFRIRAYKTYGNTKQYGSWSSEVKVNTNPYGVSGFKCSSKTSTSVTLKWNKGTTASGYQLQQYKDGKWVTIYTGTKATNTSYTVKGLKAGTAGYRFRIRAYKTYGNTKQYGSWSSEVKVNTNPYGVSGFKCSSKTSTSVTLKWNKGTTASGYQLQQYKNGKWVTIYTGTKATNTSYTVKGLKAGTAGYRFRIRAYKTYGNTKQYGSWSSEVKVNTNPYGVGGFKAKSTAKNSITLGWNKGTTASGYQLQQYKGGKWVTVYTGTKATSTSYTVKSLKANTSYKFRIRAYKTYGNAKQYGSWSSTLTVKTKR